MKSVPIMVKGRCTYRPISMFEIIFDMFYTISLKTVFLGRYTSDSRITLFSNISY